MNHRLQVRENIPSFTVVVPTHNRPTQLTACLRSLAGLDYPRDRFEVIVVDDGSTQPIDELVEPFQDGMNLTLLRTCHEGPGPARNAGASIASGRFLAFTDDDCEPAPNWLQALNEHFREHPDEMVGGRTTNRLVDNAYSVTSQLIVNAAYAHYNHEPASARFFASNNMAISTAMLRKVGGFDPKFRIASEDRDLCKRWLTQGFKMRFAPEAVVYHFHQLTFRRFCRQHFNYGRGSWRYHQVHSRKEIGSLREVLSFHVGLPWLLRKPMSNLGLGQKTQVGGLLLIWELVNAAGFVYEKYCCTSNSGKKCSDRCPHTENASESIHGVVRVPSGRQFWHVNSGTDTEPQA